MRGFCFMIALWGEEHRGYFTDCLLPSLLAPGNLPVIENKTDSKFLIATTEDDWIALHNSETFLQLTDHIEPLKFPLDPASSHIARCGKALVYMTNYAHASELYGATLTPDQIWSSNVIEELQRLARGGAQLVVFPPVRLSKERLFNNLQGNMAVGADQLASASMQSLHPEWDGYEWDGPYWPTIAGEYWRRLPAGGMLRHSFCWMPLLIDYSACVTNDTTAFKAGHYLDGDYLWSNTKGLRTVALRDAKRIFIAPFTPEAEGPHHTLPRPTIKWLGPLFHAQALRHTMQLGYLKGFPMELLVRPIIWGDEIANPLPLHWHIGKRPSWLLDTIPKVFRFGIRIAVGIRRRLQRLWLREQPA